MFSASFFARYVFPTPVGPRNMKAPMGWLGSLSPILLRWMAFTTFSIALSCATTSPLSVSPILRRRALSLGDSLGWYSCHHRHHSRHVVFCHVDYVVEVSFFVFLFQFLHFLLQLRLLVAEACRQFEVLVSHCVLFLSRHLGYFLFRFCDFRRHLCVLQVCLGSCLVESVDRLVGELSFGDVSVSVCHACLYCLVGVSHGVVVFVSFLYVCEDVDGFLRCGLFHYHLLESPLQCTVFFYRLAVFVECGSSDALYGASCQCRFEHVCSVHGAWC